MMTPVTAASGTAVRPTPGVAAAGPRTAPARPEPARAPAASSEPARARPAGPPEPKRPSVLARGLSAAAGALVRGSSTLFGQVRTRGATAVGDFRARPEHSRWRAYALGCYGLIVAATLTGQLYSSNPLGVYVKVQHVELPVSTLIFVRNDSSFAWKHARIVVNGIYSHSRDEIAAGESLPLDLDKAFAVKDGSGKILRRPPKNLLLQSLALDCDRGRYETELK
ncbi:MAG TPA: hypothetical protein VEQ15_11485 [Myxococcales bacterium]|jgi:hypothetical protein|nr:hypothetical protein [Myxococcales bacterium]